MAKQLLNKFKEDYFTLVEAGFIAINSMDEDSALKLFKAAELLEPENMFPKVGYGYMYMCKLELKLAAKMFEETLAKEPDNEIARTLLGLTLAMTPTRGAEGEKMLEKSKSSPDSEIKHLAKDSQKFIDEFVKKKPTPMDVQKNAAKQKKK